MARKRHRKWKRQREQDGKEMHETSLEEDLRLQRKRQQERLKKVLGEQINNESMSEEDDENAADIDVPFPSQASLSLPQHWIKKGNIQPWPNYTPEFSSFWGLAMTQHSPTLSSRRRGRLGYWTASKFMLENLSVNPRASALYSRKIKWADHLLPNELHCSGDLTCKHHLQPSARTLDVARSSLTDTHSGGLPAVATVLHGGWGLYQPPTERFESRIQTLRCKPVHAIRMHEKTESLGTIMRNDQSTTSYKFQWYSLAHTANYMEIDLPHPVHDFCFGTDLAVFACPRFGRNSNLAPLFLPLNHNQQSVLRSLNVQNFPQSDALRVEMSCQHEKYLAFGHRNGQVSLLDLRQSHTCSAIISPGSPTELGSATDLAFLASQRQLLVKRSFGPCQLHDLRKLSPCPSSLIHTLALPDSYEHAPFSYHKLLSANCNGFCVDPLTETTLVTPFINTHRQPCLGFWSLVSGDMVGSKILHDNPRHDVHFMELCPRTTPAFRGKEGSRVVDHGSFGAWMKCGRISEEKVHSKFGSLHHLSIPGRYEAAVD